MSIQTTVDTAIFTVKEKKLSVLLTKRKQNPFKDKWSLPGGFIHPEEDNDLESAAIRMLENKTGVKTPYLEQLVTLGNRKRDPRNWSITVVYFALIDWSSIKMLAGNNTSEVTWHPIVKNKVNMNLAFDHSNILNLAIERLRSKTEYSSLPIHLLPEYFTLPDLQSIYEIILGRTIDKSGFRRRILESNILELKKGEYQSGITKPAQLYRLIERKKQYIFPRVITSGTKS